MENKKLKDIAKIFTGYTFRGSLKNLPEGNLSILQAKDVSSTSTINEDNLQTASFKPANTNAVLQKNDVVITARGRFRSTTISSNKPTIASSSLYVIRPDNTMVDSNYLTSYLNSTKNQFHLNKIAMGGIMKSLHKNDLEQLNIPLPSLSKQKTISKLYQNISKQKKLLNKRVKINTVIAETSLHYSLNN